MKGIASPGENQESGTEEGLKGASAQKACELRKVIKWTYENRRSQRKSKNCKERSTRYKIRSWAKANANIDIKNSMHNINILSTNWQVEDEVVK